MKNIKKYYIPLLRKIRNFLLSDKCREFLFFLFFVFISFCFWLLQILNETYQTEFKIPLRLKNVPKEVVLTSDIPSEIRVKVEDRGTILLNYMLGRTFFPATFDFADYENKGTRVVIPASELSKKIATQLNGTTRILAIRPDTVDFIYTRGTAMKVPVAVNKEVTTGRQYYVSDVKCQPDSVTVYAPEEVLKNVLTAYTQPIDLKDITDTVVKHVPLQTIRGIKYVPSSVEVAVCVDMYSEKTVEVPVIGFDFPKGKVLRTFPSKVQVTFQVGLANFKSITANDFLVGVVYPDLQKESGDKATVILRATPEHVSHIRISPATIDYLIEEQTVLPKDSLAHD